MIPTPEIAWDVGAMLGEGPVWLADEGALRFVDIRQGRLLRFDPASGARETLEVGGNPGFIVPAEGGALIVGSRQSLHLLENGRLGRVLALLDEPAGNRCNDATVDPSGRLWLGTMDDAETRPSGAIWCLDRGTLHRSDLRAVVTNGPAVSGDGRWLYVADSGERTIWRYPLGSAPVLGQGEVFVRLGEDEGYPDGIVTDAEDCLWVALWDGWGLRRYAPDGTLLLHIAFPCARITKVAFGGPDLRTGFVTTARVGLSEEDLSAQPQAGGLFTFASPVAGRALPAVRLT